MKQKTNYTVYRLSLLLILILLYGNHFVSAQVLVGGKLGGGISWSTFEDKSYKDFYASEPVFGYNVSISTASKVRKRFYLHVDLGYSRRGKKIKGIDDPALKNKAVYHYFNLPIIYRVDFKSTIKGTDFKWFLGAGPNINYWWKGMGTLRSSELDEIDIEVLDYKVEFGLDPNFPDADRLYIEDPNRFQFGLLLSAGLVFEPQSDQFILVELRFEWGNTYLAKGEGVFPNVQAYKDDLRVRTNALLLSVSYLFDTKISEKKKGKSNYKN
jgi:hypothetical protein